MLSKNGSLPIRTARQLLAALEDGERLERSKFGKLLAPLIEFRRADFRVFDTLSLVRLLEFFVEGMLKEISKRPERQQEELARVHEAVRAGDRRELIEYLKSGADANAVRTLTIECLETKRKAARRPKARATESRAQDIATFVANRMFAGLPYMGAVKDAQEKFRCSDKTVMNACEKNAIWVGNLFDKMVAMVNINPMAAEILRRGEPKYCEQVRKLLDRLGSSIDSLPPVPDDERARGRWLTPSLRSGK